MERDEFLKTLGISFAMVCAGTCFQACGKKGDGDPDPGTGTGTTASVEIASLPAVGSKVTANGILFFRIAASNSVNSFIATAPVCTHEAGQLIWVQAENRIRCTNHGAEFSSAGTVLLGPATTPLRVYPVTLTGTTLIATKS